MAVESGITKLPPIAPGQRYGRLVAVAFVERGPHYSARWRFKCDCGGETVIDASAARKGNTKSCGCFKSEMSVVNGRTLITHGMSHTREYDVWTHMCGRCHNPASKDYPNYGARGVRVCERWREFENFYADMGQRPTPRHSLDRHPDKNGNYEPGNVRWATPKEQCRNQRKTIFVTYKGAHMPLIEAAERAGIPYTTVKNRLRSGWTADRALKAAAARPDS